MQHCKEHNTVLFCKCPHCSCVDNILETLTIFFSKRDPREIQRIAYFECQTQILVRLKYKTENIVFQVLSSREGWNIFQLQLLPVRHEIVLGLN